MFPRRRHPTCHQCGDQIRWVDNADGDDMPLEAATDPDGTIRVIHQTDDLGQIRPVACVLEGLDLDHARRRGEALWSAHAAVCRGTRQGTGRMPDHIRQKIQTTMKGA